MAINIISICYINNFVKDEPGQLLRVMQSISQANMNLSKLQSFPVLGKVGEYYFYLDIEFDELTSFWRVYEEMKHVTLELQILGIYQRAQYCRTRLPGRSRR